MTARERRWHGAVIATAAFALAGIVDTNGVLLLAAAVPLAYVLGGSLSTATVPDGLTVSRRVAPSPAPPGRSVAVELTVENTTGQSLSDLRIVDGVPRGLAVTAGSPRAGTSLDPGESTTLRYVLTARRGVHEFDAPRVTVRGLGAGARAERRPATDGDDTAVCRLDADAPPIDETGDGRVGHLTTDDPGEGVTFHSTREYRYGDDASRIDWREYAKQGELTTVSYERRTTATVVLVVDAREPCRVVPGPGRPTATERGAYAATQVLTDLLAAGHEVGLAVVGLEGPDAAGLHWLTPGAGGPQRTRALELLETASEPTSTGEHPETQFRTVIDLAPPGAQLALLSPLLDDPPADAVETWLAAQRPVTVLSPDATSDNTVSGQQAAVERRARLAGCQLAGARTVDWRRGTPLAIVIERAFAVEARRPTGGRP